MEYKEGKDPKPLWKTVDSPDLIEDGDAKNRVLASNRLSTDLISEFQEEVVVEGLLPDWGSFEHTQLMADINWKFIVRFNRTRLLFHFSESDIEVVYNYWNKLSSREKVMALRVWELFWKEKLLYDRPIFV